MGLSGRSSSIHRCIYLVDSYHDLEHAKTVRDWLGTHLVGFAGLFVLATSQRKIVLIIIRRLLTQQSHNDSLPAKQAKAYTLAKNNFLFSKQEFQFTNFSGWDGDPVPARSNTLRSFKVLQSKPSGDRVPFPT